MKIHHVLVAMLLTCMPAMADQTNTIKQTATVDQKLEILKEWGTPANYDPLAPNNFNLKATILKAEADGKTIHLDPTAPPTATKAMLDFFIVLKSRQGIAIHLVNRQEAVGGTPVEFSTSRKAMKMYRGDFSKSALMTYNNSKLVGWFVRAIRDNKIVGVASSSKEYAKLAADPATIEQMFKDQQVIK